MAPLNGVFHPCFPKQPTDNICHLISHEQFKNRDACSWPQRRVTLPEALGVAFYMPECFRDAGLEEPLNLGNYTYICLFPSDKLRPAVQLNLTLKSSISETSFMPSLDLRASVCQGNDFMNARILRVQHCCNFIFHLLVIRDNVELTRGSSLD